MLYGALIGAAVGLLIGIINEIIKKKNGNKREDVKDFTQNEEEEYREEDGKMNNGKAIASLVLGIVGLIAWILPLVGFPVTIVGLVMGVSGRKSEKKGMATAGMVLSIIALVACIINSALGAYLGVTGQL